MGMNRKPLWVVSVCRVYTAGVWSFFLINRLGDGPKPFSMKQECFKIGFLEDQNTGSTLLEM